MKIVVSACLLGENCKYDGTNNKNLAVIKHLEGKEIISICPEVLGGLGIPRIACEWRGDKVFNQAGQDQTIAFYEGVKKAMDDIPLNEVAYAILKSKSPSCGKGFIYDGSFQGKLIRKDGLLVSKLKEKNIKVFHEGELDKIKI